MVKYLYLLALLLCSFLAYDYGSTKVNKRFSEYKLQQEQLLKEANIKNRTLEQQIVTNQNLNRLNRENEINTINVRHAAIVSSLQDRTRRPSTSTDSKAATPDTTGAGSTGQQLFREDAEFLIGEAAKAMILRESLKSCRNDYNAITKE